MALLLNFDNTRFTKQTLDLSSITIIFCWAFIYHLHLSNQSRYAATSKRSTNLIENIIKTGKHFKWNITRDLRHKRCNI